MKVSIVIPVYNVQEDYFDQCMRSVLGQSYGDIEVILVDDGAMGALPGLCDEYSLKDSRVMVLHQQNGGASAARNAGLSVCTGDYVTFVDSDDYIDVDTIKVAIDYVQKQGLQVLLWGSYKCYGDRNEPYMPYNSEISLFSENLKQELMLKCMVGSLPFYDSRATQYGAGSCCSKLYETQFLRDNNLKYPVGILRAEDVNFNIRVFELASRIGYLNRHFYYYRQVESSATFKYRENGIQVFTDALACLDSFISQYDKPEIFRRVYNMRCMFFYLESMDMDYLNSENKKSLKIRLSEMRLVLKQKPYAEAIRCLRYKDLSMAKRVPLFLMKHEMLGTLCVLWKLYSMKG